MYASVMYMIDFSDSPWSGTPDDLLVGTMMGRSLLPTYIFKQSWDQGSHFFGLTKFHDISMIFPGFSVIFQVFFHYF